MLLAHFANHVFHLFLRGDDNPGPAPTLGGEALGNGLQVGHQLGVVGNVLADLVHKEVQAELFVATLFCLLLDIGIHIVREVFNRDSVFAAVLVQNARCRLRVATGHSGVGFGNIGAFQKGLLPAFLPGATGDGLVLGFELFVQATAVQIALKLGNVPLFAVVAAHFVEDFNEHGQKRINLGFADDIGFLIDVEQNALRRN